LLRLCDRNETRICERKGKVTESFPRERTERRQVTRGRTTQMPDLIDELARLIVTIRPLAEELASDAHGAEDRRLLREKTGDDGVFRASNAMNRLCGKRAMEFKAKGKEDQAMERGHPVQMPNPIKALAALILAIRPLAKQLVSDQHSAEERRLLREKTSDDDISRTANALNQLCGERARAVIRGRRYRRLPGLPP
jgi:hypothetical protein